MMVTTAIAYNAKISALHGEDRQDSSWTHRQTGVHHQYDAASRSNTFVILYPSGQLAEHFSSLATAEDFAPASLHLKVLTNVTEPWDDYLSYEEEQFEELVS